MESPRATVAKFFKCSFAFVIGLECGLLEVLNLLLSKFENWIVDGQVFAYERSFVVGDLFVTLGNVDSDVR